MTTRVLGVVALLAGMGLWAEGDGGLGVSLLGGGIAIWIFWAAMQARRYQAYEERRPGTFIEEPDPRQAKSGPEVRSP